MISLSELKATTPKFTGTVKEMLDSAYKWTKRCLCPLMADGEKGEILILDEKGRFNHIYFYSNGDCEVWHISDEEAVEWANSVKPMPYGWPYNRRERQAQRYIQ